MCGDEVNPRVLIPFQTGHHSNKAEAARMLAEAVLIPFQTGHHSNPPVAGDGKRLPVLIPFQTGHHSNEDWDKSQPKAES